MRETSVSDEPHRPGFHFTASRNWLNDPNGLVWYDGEYHLFYQYNPEGPDWGNMSWGHATTPDLVHWTELPVALEFSGAEHVFSGSVVVDHRNTSGLGTDGAPAMVAVYTAHDPVTRHEAQALAWSGDRGATWTRYAANPVLDIGQVDFRDPKVFWHEPTGCWVMAVALPVDQVVRLYRSDDLISWTHLSDFSAPGADPGLWECPDLFELPVDGDPDDSRWVLLVSLGPGGDGAWLGTQYFVGRFDGTAFTPDPDWARPRRLDQGADYYAAVSFTDDPREQRILMAWMNNWNYAAEVPTSSFRGSMAVPRILTLERRRGRIQAIQAPVAALEALRRSYWSLDGRPIPPGTAHLPDDASGDQLEIHAEFWPEDAERFGLQVRVGGEERTVVGYDVPTSSVYVDRRASGAVDLGAHFATVHTAPLGAGDGLVSLTVLVDRASVEVFGNDGEQVITGQVFPRGDSTGVALFAEGGTARLVGLRVTRLGALDRA
jgi:fructan beta-fructosidase